MLKQWMESEPTVPNGDWFNRFKTGTRAGHGEEVATLLLRQAQSGHTATRPHTADLMHRPLGCYHTVRRREAPSLAWIGLAGSIGPLWGYPRVTWELAFRRVSGTARLRRMAHAGSDSLEPSAAANHAVPAACGRAGQIHRRRRANHRTDRGPRQPDARQALALASALGTALRPRLCRPYPSASKGCSPVSASRQRLPPR